MFVRFALLLGIFAIPATTLAQADPTPMRILAPAPRGEIVKVAIDTDKGRIVLALDKGRAPLTTDNFLAYVDRRWFDGQSFYRAFRYGEGGVIQGGVRDGAKQLPPIAVEPTTKTGLANKAWTIAMANAGPASTRSDFFIMTTDIPAFDAKGADIGFAAFGRVVEGQEVVNAVLASPVSPTKGEGSMKGQMLERAVKIVKAARVEN
jgi:peptidyl-prolyl cis-trans isomerase A (cyclophilin A)